MVKGIQATVFCMALLCGSTMAAAENIKFYMGLGFGSFTADYGSTAAGTSIKGDAKFGSYVTVSADLTPYFATEFRYGLVGKSTLKRNASTWANHSVTISSLSSVLLKPQFPLGKYGHIYGLLGFTSVALDYTNANATINTKGTDISFGAGFNIHIADTWAIGGDYVRYTGKQDFIINKARVTGVGININYMFD